MIYKGHSINEFKVSKTRVNTCNGCYFADESKSNLACWTLKTSPFIEALFNTRPKTKGTCKNYIATLKKAV